MLQALPDPSHDDSHEELSTEPEVLSPAPSPDSFLLDTLVLPSLSSALTPDQGLPKTRAVAYYHWVHITSRVSQLLEDLEERINDKNPSKVVIHLEGVGGEPLGRIADATRFTHLINNSRWLTRPYLAVTDWLTRISNPGSSMAAESLKMQSHLLKELGRVHDRTGVHIELNYIDICNHDPEIETLHIADRSQMQQMLIYSLDCESIKLLVQRSTESYDVRSLSSQYVSQALVDMRASLTARDKVVARQLQQRLEQAEPDELHAVLTGAGHKSVARIIPGELRNRIAVALSPALMDFLPDEFRSVSLGCPYSYAVERIISHPDAPEPRDINIAIFGSAMHIALHAFLYVHSDIFQSFSAEDRSDLSRLLACNIATCMPGDELDRYTQRLFDGAETQKGASLKHALEQTALEILQWEIEADALPMSALARKVFAQLDLSFEED